MTPRFDFESGWAEVSRDVDAFLMRCRVPEALRDDLLQETALRIFLLGDNVDPSRPVRALAKTIALNLLRDHIRKERRLVPVFDLTLVGEVQSVESEVLARDEWARVSNAMNKLNPAQRAALLETVGLAPSPAGASASAIRVVRMRARRQLRAILDAMSRGRDLCALSTREIRKAFSLRRVMGNHLPHSDQVAQLGTAVAAVVVASFMSGLVVVDAPRARSPHPESPRISTSAGRMWPGIPLWSHAETGRLAMIAAAETADATAERARREARVVTHRVSLGKYGYVEGDEDELHGVAIMYANEAVKTIENPRRVVRRVKRSCESLGLCRR